MGNEAKFTLVKPQLKTVIDKIEITPNSLLIVRPRDNFSKFTTEYAEWLSENIADLLPPGTMALILPDASTTFKTVDPPHNSDDEDIQYAYEAGWSDALVALEKLGKAE